MNNPYEIDILMENVRKRKYHEIESVLRKKITYKKCKYCNDTFYLLSKKRMYDLQDNIWCFSKIRF